MTENESPEHVYTNLYSRLIKTYFTKDRVPFDYEKRKRKVKVAKRPSRKRAS